MRHVIRILEPEDFDVEVSARGGRVRLTAEISRVRWSAEISRDAARALAAALLAEAGPAPPPEQTNT